MKRARVMMDGIRFVLGVQEVQGEIVAEQGMVMFHSPEKHLVTPMPVYVPPERYGERITVCTHVGGRDILTVAGDDDVLVSNMRKEYLDLLVSKDVLNSFLDTWKTSRTSSFVSHLAMFAVVSLLCLLSALFRIYPVVYITAVAILPYYRLFNKSASLMETTVVWDSYGHWVDLDSGRTNLNGGFQLW